jgi:hypothetical protein
MKIPPSESVKERDDDKYLPLAILFYLIGREPGTIHQSDTCAHFLSHPSIRNPNHLPNNSIRKGLNSCNAAFCSIAPLIPRAIANFILCNT